MWAFWNPKTWASSKGVFALLGIILFFFLLIPIAYVFTQSFWVDGRFSLAFFNILMSNALLTKSIWNSLLLGVVITVASCVLGIPLALIVTRFDFKGKTLAQGLLLVPLIMPPFVGALGVQRLFSKYGSINLLLMKWGIFDTPIDFFGDGGFWGVVIVQALHLYPIMYLNLVAALSNIDPSLEEAAQSMGANRGRLFRTVLLPLMKPGFFAGASIVFIWAFTDLGTPLMFNFRATMPVQIYNMINDINENPMGFVMVVLLMVMSITFFLLSKSYVGKTRYTMMARGHITPRSTVVTGWGLVAIYAVILGTVFIALLPHLGVVLNSLADRWAMTILPTHATLDYFSMLKSDPLASNSIKVSLYLSAMSTLVDVFLGVAVAYVLTRKRFRGSDLLDSLVMLPLALPGVVLAFGYVATFSHTFLDPRVNPIPLLVISYAIRRMPYMVRSACAGFQQTPVALEEASMSLGVGPLKTSLRITLPLITANLVAGGMLCFAYAMLEVSDSMILAMKEQFFPMTKAIYVLFNNLSVGMGLASALGVIGMIILTASILGASKVLGKRLGELFRAG